MNKFENIKIVILAGNRDFGRCPLASDLPISLWPIAGRSAVEHLIGHLADQGVTQVTVCSNGDVQLLKDSITPITSIELKFLDEALPIGTAGCIRDAAKDSTEELLIVFPAGITIPPSVDEILDEHHKADSDMTIIFNPSIDNNGPLYDSAQIYICQRSILEFIPDIGYCDVKETLIPEMIKAGKTIYAGRSSQSVGNFRSWAEYLEAIGSFLENAPSQDPIFSGFEHNGPEKIWLGKDVNLDSSARILGPVIIGNHAKISEDAVILGPAIIGNNTNIGGGTLVANSIIWNNSYIGRYCEIRNSVVGHNAVLPNNHSIENQALAAKRNNIFKRCLRTDKSSNNCSKQKSSFAQTLIDKMNARLPAWVQYNSRKLGVIHAIGIIALFIVFLWSYWPIIADLWGIWQRSDEYSSGLLVPFLAVYVLWLRRNEIAGIQIKPFLWGIVLFVFAQAFRIFGLFFMYSSAERISIVLSIHALVLLLFGWKFTKKMLPVLLFLFLMLPWPKRVQAFITLPLQKWATTSAVYCLETIGYDVVREGNVIHIGQTTIAVAEACNGLRMITAFFVIIGLLALIIKKPLWQKIVLFISSLPIALLCNTIRLVVTSIAFTVFKGEHWEIMFHDYGGYAMMPLAIAMAVGELWLITKLTIPPDTKKQTVIIRVKS